MQAEIADTKELVHELEKVVEGEVRFDKYSRVLYSTDASIYQIEPLGVVIPRHADDVIATMKVAARHGVPVLPRGGGSSLAGQTVGKAVIIDMAKYMDQILEVNQEERWVRVQPGVVLDQLNGYLLPYGLQFGPDPASSDRACMGGILGNNSTGTHSILYGLAVDHVLETDVVLSDGTLVHLGPLDEAGLEAKLRREDLEGSIYRQVKAIVQDNMPVIEKDYPKWWRRAGGYNLDRIAQQLNGDGAFNLTPLVVGSEGTFVAMTEARLNLVPRPKMTALDIVHFDDLIQAMESTPIILGCNPSAVELMDELGLTLTREVPEYARRLTWIEGNPNCVLIVEFRGESEAELRGKLDELEAHLKRHGIGTAFVRATTPQAIANVWGVRKAGLGLMMGIKGDHKPIPFIEDPAVPVEHLAEYISGVRDLCARHDVRMAAYAHASAGCIHVRPLINLKDVDEVETMHTIARVTCELVMKYGGAMSSEHGDGLARSEFNERVFGPELYGLFKEVKTAFDPQGIMNPGKVVDFEPMTHNLRYGEDYRAIQVRTHFDFSDMGGFDRAIEMCNGAGVCRKIGGTMCPSYMATRDEEHSTRGRANALRAAISGALPYYDLTSDRMLEVLDLCLECKGCKAECPSAVDMAKLKSEVLAQRIDRYGAPLRSQLFARIHDLSRLGSGTAPLSNIMANSPLGKAITSRLGIAPERQFPSFAVQSFEGWLRKHRNGHGPATRGQVVLFNDTFVNYNYPEIGRAAVKVLEAAGFEVVLADHKCCGRPMISKGLLEEARANAKHNVEVLSSYAWRGVPIVGIEPSCLLTLRDEYFDLLDDPRAKVVAEHCFLIEEFMGKLLDEGGLDLRFNSTPSKVLVHGHCHQKSLVGTNPTLRMLQLLPDCEVEEIPSGCCGMAGSFGFEEEHYDISMQIGELELLPAVRAANPDTIIAAAGTSCRQQIAHGTGRKAKHPIEVLADALVG